MFNFKTPIVICVAIILLAICASALLTIGDLKLYITDYVKIINGLRQDLIKCQVKYRECSIENAKLREYVAKAWNLFVKYGAVHACDLNEVDAIRGCLREVGIEVD